MSLSDIFKDANLSIELRNLVSALRPNQKQKAIEALRQIVRESDYQEQCRIHKASLPQYTNCASCGRQVEKRKPCWNCRINSP